MKYTLLSFFKSIALFTGQRKFSIAFTALLLVLSVSAAGAADITNVSHIDAAPVEHTVPSEEELTSSQETVIEVTVEEIVSEPESTVSVSSNKVTAVKKSTTTVTAAAPTVTNTDYKYNGNTDVNNNVFLDALIYTGYNIEKHRADGNMWKYVLASRKRGLGYLSKITYGGGCTGLETDASGKPNIAAFERGGLVCASFVTYVYFNYLPNVAGIDTSSLTRPNRTYYANDFYTAVKDWVNKGYSEYIPFTYKVLGATGNSFITFNPSRDIPIGSVIVFRNPQKAATYGAHVAIYAGTVNDYHWLFHVGTANGPEFCAVERMNFGPNPRWPIAVITPPSNIRFSPVLEIELKDDSGAPISGVPFTLKNASGSIIDLGSTDANGKIKREGLSYGTYELTQAVPEGYTCDTSSRSINLTTANNSYNSVSIINTKTPPPEEVPEPTPSEPQDTSSDGETPSLSEGEEKKPEDDGQENSESDQNTSSEN